MLEEQLKIDAHSGQFIHRLPNFERIVGLLVCLLVIGILIFLGPLATNDGPVHMAFARMLQQGPGGPLQNSIYVVRPGLDPNLLCYWIAGPLIPLMGSDAAETVLQCICLLGIPLAAWFAMSGLRALRGESAAMGLVVAVGILALNEMFFLGLYNYSLSLVFALLSFGMLMRAVERNRWWWLVYSASLVITFFAHAAGLIMALSFSLAWLSPCLLPLFEGRLNVKSIAKLYGRALLAASPVTLLMAQFAARQGRSISKYGEDGPIWRARYFLRLGLAAVGGRLSGGVALVLAVVIMGLSAWVFWARMREWRIDPSSRVTTVRFALLLVGCVTLVMTFPDVAGGGWTHFFRMTLFPYIGALLLCATHPWTIRVRAWLLAGAVSILVVQLSIVGYVQIPAKRGIAKMDRIMEKVGADCTILPIIPEPGSLGLDVPRIKYEPFFQAATRIERTHDRVALFNFLARLNVYPVAFRPGLDPQSLIFHWKPAQTERVIFAADVASYEKATGIPVNFILVEGNLATLPAPLKNATAGYHLVAEAFPLHLFERAGSEEGRSCASSK